MQINKINNKFNWIYYTGFFVILALPLFTFSPWMYPADFPKTIIFRSILSILGFLLLYQNLKNNPNSPILYQGFAGLRKTSNVVWALAGLLFIFSLSSLFSIDPYFSFWGSPWRGGGFVTFAFYFVFAILTFVILKDREWQKVWDFSIFIGILVSLVAICQYYSLFSKLLVPMTSRPSSTLGNPILLAIYLLLLFFITISFFLNEKMHQKKIYYGISILIFAFTIFITGTRAVWAGIVIGLLYFLLFYPTSHSEGSKKLQFKTFLNLSRIIAGLFILAVVLIVTYINIFPNSPKTLQENRFLQTLESRLSIKNALNDERFLGWQVAIKSLKDKPVLGWGPENFAVGFDKNYDPKIISSFWWDKAHNIILDTGVQTGILGIIVYLLLFTVLFYQLQKVKYADKNAKQNADNTLMSHGMQATLIGYLVANFFSFDSFSTYLIFFLLIAYTLHLTNKENNSASQSASTQRLNQRGFSAEKIVIGLALIFIIFFIYQYNLKPFFINAEINKAKNFVNQKNCTQGLNTIEKAITKHSFLDSYIRMEYVELTKICSGFYPENNLTYINRGQELIKEAVKIQPLYTRYYLYLGNTNNILAIAKQDPQTKKELINNAYNYFNKALQLAPKHQEIFIEQSKLSITANDFLMAQNYAQKCININPNYANCYWQLAISQIYSKDVTLAQNNVQTAKEKGYNIDSKTSLGELSDAYGSVPDYKNLALIYEKFILLIDPNVAQYHSSLAFFYKQLGEYKKAREEAIKTLQLSPESKQAVDDFLRTLPY
jgi:O-antigen ligase